MVFTLSFLKLFFYGLGLAAPLLVFLLAVILVSGQIAGHREGWSRFEALYWSLITATTVGYGDFRPVQKLSRILAVFMALTGIVFTGIMVSIALFAAGTAFNQQKDLDKVKTQLENMRQ